MKCGFTMRQQVVAAIHAKVLRLNSAAVGHANIGRIINLARCVDTCTQASQHHQDMQRVVRWLLGYLNMGVHVEVHSGKHAVCRWLAGWLGGGGATSRHSGRKAGTVVVRPAYAAVASMPHIHFTAGTK
jgi:hypothetical protein